MLARFGLYLHHLLVEFCLLLLLLCVGGLYQNGKACSGELLWKAHLTMVIHNPSTLKPCDWELVLVMESVRSADLVDEFGFARTFRYRNDTSIYVAAVLSHVRSVCELRVPLPDGYSFHRAPAWNKIPQKGMAPILFKMPSK